MSLHSAHYHDGKTAARHRVAVRLLDDALAIAREDGGTERWTYAGLALCEEAYAGGPARLRHEQAGDARLVVDTDTLAALVPAAPRLARRRVAHPLAWRLATALFLLVLVAVGLILGVPRLAAPLAAMVPLEWERALGAQVAGAMAGQTCHDPAGDAALAALVAQLAPHAHSPVPFEVRVVRNPDQPVVNAFAAPGGQILIYQGLIEFTRSPRELAGVLGHEMAHVRHRHPTEGLIRALGLRVAASAIFGDLGSVGAIAGDLGANLLNLSYGRDAERQADSDAVATLQEAGLDSRGLAEFFQRLAADKEDGGTALPALLSTHPLTGERIATMRRLSRSGEPPLDPEQWLALRAICASADAGDAPAESSPSI